MRKVALVTGEIYHVYNRGVDKRSIFKDRKDLERFFRSMLEFNQEMPIGSIHENSFRKRRAGAQLGSPTSKLVDILCYCLNPNHFHFILRQAGERGVEKFMQRLGTGYTKYFNTKYERSGALFQGKYKSSHIDTDAYLLHVSAYVNLNDKCHKFEDGSVLSKSSWGEYIGTADEQFCDKDIILSRFNDKEEYREFAESSLAGIIERKKIAKESRDIFID